MTTPPELKPGIRWGRAILGGLLIEIGLIAVVVPFYASGDMDTPLVVIPPATLVFAIAAGWWAARPAERALTTGMLAGVFAFLIYAVPSVVGMIFAPDQADMSMALSPAYLASHVFKVLGAAAGGWWVVRSRGAQAA